MGWSCTSEQSKALERLHTWERAQDGWKDGKPDTLFFEFNPNGQDYGDTIVMRIAVMKMTGESQCIKIGTVKILGDGTYKGLPGRVKLEEVR